VVAVLAASSMSAHRRDEYLQAARLTIDPDRVEIALDLTPGIAVADVVRSEIDGDGDGAISRVEGHDYVRRILGALALDVDGRPLQLDLIDHAFPEVEAIRRGEGTIRIHASAALPRLGEGVHRLRYRNGHRPEIGAYLANALVPASDRVSIGAQRRDVDQRELTIEYTLRADASARTRAGLFAGLAVALILAGMASWRRYSVVKTRTRFGFR